MHIGSALRARMIRDYRKEMGFQSTPVGQWYAEEQIDQAIEMIQAFYRRWRWFQSGSIIRRWALWPVKWLVALVYLNNCLFTLFLAAGLSSRTRRVIRKRFFCA